MSHAYDGSTSGSGPDLLVRLAEDGKGSLRRRLRESVRGAIRDGRLPSGSRLPSSRALAADLGVSRGVVVDAYAQLTAEGFLSSQPGSGTVVADTGAQQPARAVRLGIAAPEARSTTLEIDLRPGPPDLSTFPRGAGGRPAGTSCARSPMPSSATSRPGGSTCCASSSASTSRGCVGW